MKVLTILGSPRKDATSTTIAHHFNKEATANGAEVTTYTLNDMDYKGCQGCYSCKTGKESCILNDDLTPLFEALDATDVVVIATPIYFGDITAQLKGFFDRFYSTVSPEYFETGIPTSRLPQGKKSLIIATQGAEEKEHADIAARYDSYFALSGFTDRKIIRDCNRQDFTDKAPAAASISMAESIAREFATA